jgi:hypothetical protein
MEMIRPRIKPEHLPFRFDGGRSPARRVMQLKESRELCVAHYFCSSGWRPRPAVQARLLSAWRPSWPLQNIGPCAVTCRRNGTRQLRQAPDIVAWPRLGKGTID